MRKPSNLHTPTFATLAAYHAAAALVTPFASFAAFWSTSAGKYLLQLGIVFVAYLVGGRIGLIVPFTSGNVSPVWPAAGIAMAAFLLVGYRVWPAIATAAFLVNLFTPIPALAALGIAAGNTAGPLAGAWLTRRISGFTPSLTRLKDVFGIILIAAPTGAAISACVGVTVLFGTGGAPWVTFGRAWAVWWLGDSMGVLILTPLALTLFGRPINSRRQAAELGALLASVAVTCLLMFHPAVERAERDSVGGRHDSFRLVGGHPVRGVRRGRRGLSRLLCSVMGNGPRARAVFTKQRCAQCHAAPGVPCVDLRCQG